MSIYPCPDKLPPDCTYGKHQAHLEAIFDIGSKKRLWKISECCMKCFYIFTEQDRKAYKDALDDIECGKSSWEAV